MGEYKTPGVYIKEKNAFGNSVVEAETAIPAFIGLTEMALNGHDDLTNVPWKISSMTEFVKFFGGAPKPEFKVEVTKYHPKAKLVNGTTEPKKAVLRPNNSLFQVDITTKGKEIIDSQEYNLSYAFTITSEKKLTLYYQMQMFFANGGGTCYVVSVGGYNTKNLTTDVVTKALDELKKEREVTMIVVPEAVFCGFDECSNIQQMMMKHCGEVANRFALLDIHQEKGTTDFQEKVTNYFSYGAAYYPWLNASVLSNKDIDESMFTWKDSVFMYGGQLAKSDAALVDILLFFCGEQETKKIEKDGIFEVDGSTIEFKDLVPQYIDGGKITKVEDVKDNNVVTGKNVTIIKFSKEKLTDETKKTLYQALFNDSPLFKQAVKAVLAHLNCLPPSAAMAGIYTMVDKTRGVWKAPANVALNYVVSPTEVIDDKAQESLNAPMNGKAINVIRTFRGEGVKVWGARTLDGNSLDWRYINVRRTMLFLEESVRNAARAYIFEPNDASTWINMQCMIENFLRSVWKRGGLAGATPEEAFEVHVGLGDTMTGEDILEGIMRITVLVAISRPAEFIEITFQQQMQKS